MEKELLTIEFRYLDEPIGEHDCENRKKTITIGVFDTIEEAISEGNKALSILSENFEVREDDRFKTKGLWGLPKRLVTNCCYPTNGIQYFAHITPLRFDNLKDTISKTFEAFDRYKRFKNNNQ